MLEPWQLPWVSQQKFGTNGSTARAGNCRGFAFEDAQQEALWAQGLLCSNRYLQNQEQNPWDQGLASLTPWFSLSW